MATKEECKQFIETIAPYVCKYAKEAGIHMAGFVIAQCCEESGWGQSARAIYQHNIVGDIMTGKDYGSWENCIKSYFTWDIVNNDQARAAKTFDEYAKVLFYGNNPNGYVYGEPEAVETLIRPIYNQWNLEKYNDADGGNKCEEFVQKALSYKGTTGSQWASSHPKWYDAGVWCADFVSGVGEEVDILGKVFDGSASAYTCAHSVEKYGGTVHTESSYTPQRGDLVNFMWNGGSCSGGYADHIGIVTGCENGVVKTIEGNTSDMVAERSYNRGSSVLACFCSPDWSRVGGSSSFSGAILGNLFDDLNTRKDAILREAAYVETVYDEKDKKKVKEYKPTEKETPIKLSIVNYTELFQTFWDVGKSTLNIGSASGAVGDYDYSKLDSKVRTVVQYLVGKGLNNAAACGVCGNIYYESSFDTAAVGDGGTSFGICQWHLGRGDAMKQMAGSNWANNMTGQLDYLWYELENSYRNVLDTLKNVDNTESGCKRAADDFVRRFEIPANVDAQSEKRQAKAVEYFNQITQIIRSDSSGSFSSVNLGNLSGERKARVERAYLQKDRTDKGEVYYSWGGVGPNGFDCSGFVSYCMLNSYSRLGTTNTFMGYPQASNPLPGDICTNWEHCGVYIGDGQMLHCTSYSGVSGVIQGPVQSGMIIVTYGNA